MSTSEKETYAELFYAEEVKNKQLQAEIKRLQQTNFDFNAGWESARKGEPV